MSRSILAFLIIGICSLLLIAESWLFGRDHQLPSYIWVPILISLGWAMWQLRDKKNLEVATQSDQSRERLGLVERMTSDFSLRRGLRFFVIGLGVAPILIGMRFLFDGSLGSISGAAIFAIGFAAVAGFIGLFTEEVPF